MPRMTRTMIAAEPLAPLARPGTLMAVYDSRLRQVGYISRSAAPVMINKLADIRISSNS
jgi:hypothetical protein